MDQHEKPPKGSIHFGDHAKVKGDIVSGDKRVVNTGGGSYIEHQNQVDTGGGDYTGGNKTVHGDEIRQGDKIGGDKFTAHDISNAAVGPGAQYTQTGLTGQDIGKLFDAIYQKIDARPEDPDVGKEEITENVKNIQKEASKGEEANEKKIARWLSNLIQIAPDIFEVTVACILNPVMGATLAVRKVAEMIQITISNLIFDFALSLLLSLPVQFISMLIALRKIRPVETMHWSWRIYKKSALWLIPALIILLLVGDLSFLLYSKGDYHPWLPVTLVFSPFLVFILVAGGLGKYQGKGKNHPNQGIRQSAKNAGIVGILVLTGATLPLSLDLINLHIFTLKLEFLVVCFFAIPLAVFAALFFGAFACIQHIVLRFTLGICGYTPLNYVRFLDYATKTGSLANNSCCTTRLGQQTLVTCEGRHNSST